MYKESGRRSMISLCGPPSCGKSIGLKEIGTVMELDMLSFNVQLIREEKHMTSQKHAPKLHNWLRQDNGMKKVLGLL